MNILYLILLTINLLLLTSDSVIELVKARKRIKYNKKINDVLILVQIAIIVTSIGIMILAVLLKNLFVLYFYWFIPLRSVLKMIVLFKQNKRINLLNLLKELELSEY